MPLSVNIFDLDGRKYFSFAHVLEQNRPIEVRFCFGQPRTAEDGCPYILTDKTEWEYPKYTKSEHLQEQMLTLLFN